MHNKKGFSLIELLIVVAIILIIAAIAIPNMMRARMAANESAAVASMRTIFSAEVAYDAEGWNNPTAIGFSALMKDLGSTSCNPPSLTSACLLDDTMANSNIAPKSGYFFTYTPKSSGGKNTDFDLNGDPVQRGQTGVRSFYTNSTGVIRHNSTAPAGPTDPAIN